MSNQNQEKLKVTTNMDLIYNQFKKLLFKTQDKKGMPTKIIYDEQLKSDFTNFKTKENITSNRTFFIMYELSLIFILIVQIIIYYFTHLSSIMKPISIGAFILYVLVKLILYMLRYFNRNPKFKQINIFFNISIVYVCLIITVLVLKYQESSLDLEYIQFLLYYQIKTASFYIILLDINMWIPILTTCIIDLFLIILLCVQSSNYAIIYPLVSFKLSLIIIIGILKYKHNSLIRKGFESRATFQRFLKRTNQFFNQLKVNCLIFKNEDLIFLSEVAQNLIKRQLIPQPNGCNNNRDILLNYPEEDFSMIPSDTLFKDDITINNVLIKQCFQNLIPSSGNNEIGKFTQTMNTNPNLHFLLLNIIKDFSKNEGKINSILLNKIQNFGRFETINIIFGLSQHYEIDIYLDSLSSPGDILLQLRLTDISDKIIIEKRFEEIEKKYEDLVCRDKAFKHQAHEIKTPLNSIIGCSNIFTTALEEMKEIQNLDNSAKEFILKNAMRLKSISNYSRFIIWDLISKQETKVELNISEVKLIDVLQFCFDILTSLLYCDERKFKNIKPILTIGKAEKLIIKTDEIKLKQILINFLSNSMKFTNRGLIELKAKIKNSITGEILKVSVEDTGIGIKKENFNKLFSEYARFTKENNEFGSGLGLHISKVIASQLNYEIQAASEENKGTKMTLCIPLTKLEEFPLKEIKIEKLPTIKKTKINPVLESEKIYSSSEEETLRLKNDNISRFKYHRLEEENSEIHHDNIILNCDNALLDTNSKILVIDDQQFVRNILVSNLKNILQEKGKLLKYTIIEGSDGIDCLKYFIEDNSAISLIFIDENMTYMNGTQTAKILKSLPNCPNKLNIILTTADCTDDFDGDGIFDAFLCKPVKMESLVKLFNQMKL